MRPGFMKAMWALVGFLLLGTMVARWMTPTQSPVSGHHLTVYETSPAPLKLAAIYHGSTTVPESTAQAFRSAFEPLRARCREDDTRIADILVMASNLLTQRGRKQDLLTLARGLSQAIPAGSGKVDCSGVMSAIVVLTGT